MSNTTNQIVHLYRQQSNISSQHIYETHFGHFDQKNKTKLEQTKTEPPLDSFIILLPNKRSSIFLFWRPSIFFSRFTTRIHKRRKTMIKETI
jgi:hypothetical protein